MPADKINPKNLQAKCRAKKLTVSGLARQIGRTRQAIYFAAENPSRFTHTYRLMQEALS